MSKPEGGVAVVGLGRLGIPLAASIARKGFQVIGVDIDDARIAAVSAGQVPFFEPGVAELLETAGGRLQATKNLKEAVNSAGILLVAVPTPAEPDQTLSQRFLLQACAAMGEFLRAKSEYSLVVVMSTVMPGTTEAAVLPALEKASGKRCGRDFGLCYSPPFIALGSVVRDFLQPDFILIGESDSAAGDRLESFYRQVCERAAPVARMSLINAEVTKLALNTLITAKISHANLLARLCEKLSGADVDVVTAALGLDTRIGPKYLRGAISYGGPCFPRDTRALAALAAKLGAPSEPALATEKLNREQILWLAGLVEENRPTDGRVGILGLTYKPETDVVEESAGYQLACELLKRGVAVIAYDPAVGRNHPLGVNNLVTLAASAPECIQQSDVVVLTTPWEEFSQLPAEVWGGKGRPRVVVDCWRALTHLENSAEVAYLPLGRGLAPPR